MTEHAAFDGLAAVVEVVAEIADAFVERGQHLYLVGGVVRDLALGSHDAVDDIDLTTNAEPAVIKKLVKPRATALWTQGERFGTIGGRVNGRDLEITTHRADAYDHMTRQPTVTFGTSITDDLARRDFTINAMAVSVPDLALVDPFGGLGDLDRRHLVTPLRPEQSFADDPLRMLRAARFIPRFDLTVDPALEQAASDLADRLSIVSVERIQGELERLLALPAPAAGLDFLRRAGLLDHALPLFEARGSSSTAVAVRQASAAPSVDARRAALLHPLGLDGAAAALDHLRYSKAVRRRTLGLLRHRATAASEAPTAADVRRAAVDLGVDALADLVGLADAVEHGAGASFATVAAEVAAVEDLGDLASPMGGREVIRHLGVAPGPLVGRAVVHLEELRIERGPLSETAAHAALDRWWAEHGDEAVGD